MDKHMKKLVKYYAQAEGCISRKKAQKLLKKAEKVHQMNMELIKHANRKQKNFIKNLPNKMNKTYDFSDFECNAHCESSCLALVM